MQDGISERGPQGRQILVDAVAVGVCGTDVEIAEGKYGWAPPGKTRLVLRHESLGRVTDPGTNRSLKEGDLLVGIVRRPDLGQIAIRNLDVDLDLDLDVDFLYAMHILESILTTERRSWSACSHLAFSVSINALQASKIAAHSIALPRAMA